MDDHRVDAVVRAIAGSSSRRHALRLLGGPAAAAWRPRLGLAAAARQVDDCGAGLTLCAGGSEGSFCTDLLFDPNNCGGCGLPCGSGETCQAGVCQGAFEPTPEPTIEPTP